jgi:hypothetical protein
MPKPALHIITSRRPVQTAEALGRPRDERVHVRRARHVAGEGQRLAALGGDFGRDGGETIGAPRADDHRGAGARQSERSGAPDSRRGTRNRDDTSHAARIALRSSVARRHSETQD